MGGGDHEVCTCMPGAMAIGKQIINLHVRYLNWGTIVQQ